MTLPEHLRHILERSERAGVQSVHPDRLRQRVQRVYGYGDIHAELAEEMANALGRTAAHVDAALLDCAIHAQEMATRGDSPELRAAYREARRRAQRALRDLMIHREALGMYDHRRVEEEYPLPPPADELPVGPRPTDGGEGDPESPR